MTFPAWFSFYRDPVMRRHRACAQVYAALLSLDGIMYEPRAIKAWVLAEAEGLKRGTVHKALRMLVAHGYLREHGRSTHNVRMLTVTTVVSSHVSSAPKRTQADVA